MAKGNKVKKIVDTYARMVNVMAENLPEGVQVCFALYVVDSNDRDTEHLDGYSEQLLWQRATPIQRSHFTRIVDEFFRATNYD